MANYRESSKPGAIENRPRSNSCSSAASLPSPERSSDFDHRRTKNLARRRPRSPWKKQHERIFLWPDLVAFVETFYRIDVTFFIMKKLRFDAAAAPSIASSCPEWEESSCNETTWFLKWALTTCFNFGNQHHVTFDVRQNHVLFDF